jgi:TRAP-type C4-dicarboxylate transport system permease large subunit
MASVVGQFEIAPYMFALLVGLLLIICIPELSLFLPRNAGLIR